MGLKQRRLHNEQQRANGIEPMPGAGRDGAQFAGIKRVARYLKRVEPDPVSIKHPEKYLSAHERRRRDVKV